MARPAATIDGPRPATACGKARIAAALTPTHRMPIARPGTKSGVRPSSSNAVQAETMTAPPRSRPPNRERWRSRHRSTVPAPTSAAMAGARATA